MSFKIKIKGRRHWLIVNADYYVVEGGVLKFRNVRKYLGMYSDPVHTFAPGHWLEVRHDTD